MKTKLEDLRKWFGKGKKGDWVRVGTDGEIKGDCAREPGEGKPKCMPRSKAHSMDKKDRASSARRKRRADPSVDRPGTGNKPIMVKTDKNEGLEMDEALQSVTKIKFDYKDTMPKNAKPSDVGGLKQDWNNDRMAVRSAIKPLGGLVTDSEAPSRTNKFVGTLSIGTRGDASKLSNRAIQKAVKSKGAEIQNNQFMSESVDLEEKNVPTNPALWSKFKAQAKAKFDVYPSAYANGWAAKKYKAAGGGWKTTKENTEMKSFFNVRESLDLVENYRTLARAGMGTETKNSINVGREIDYYDASGSKRMGKVTKMGPKSYMVKDEKDGKVRQFTYHDRAKAKEILARIGKGKYKESVDLEEQPMTDDGWVVVGKGRKPVRFLKNPKNNKAPRNWQKSSDESEVIRVSKAKQMGIIKKEAVGDTALAYQTPYGTATATKRNTKGMRGKQDGYSLSLKTKSGKTVALGSHPNPTKANVMSIVKNVMQKEEVDEAKLSDTGIHNKIADRNLLIKAIKTAEKMGGNMTGAVREIEKMKKGLSKHKAVQAALRQANESVDLDEATSKIKTTMSDKVMSSANRFGLKATKSGDNVSVSGPKGKLNDFLRAIIGRSSYGNASEL